MLKPTLKNIEFWQLGRGGSQNRLTVDGFHYDDFGSGSFLCFLFWPVFVFVVCFFLFFLFLFYLRSTLEHARENKHMSDYLDPLDKGTWISYPRKLAYNHVLTGMLRACGLAQVSKYAPPAFWFQQRSIWRILLTSKSPKCCRQWGVELHSLD